MRTTLEDQIKAIQECRVKYPIPDYAVRRDQALNDAASSLLAMRIMCDDPKFFRKQLRAAIVNGLGDSITDNVMDFLRSKGFPL